MNYPGQFPHLLNPCHAYAHAVLAAIAKFFHVHFPPGHIGLVWDCWHQRLDPHQAAAKIMGFEARWNAA